MTQTQAYYDKMTKTPVARLIITLGIPTTISMLITNIYNMADTYFVGTLGDSAQGATGILFTLQAIIQALAFMLGHGSGVYVSKCLAQKDVKSATKYVSTAFFAGGAAAVLLSALGLAFLDPFMRLLGSTQTILPHAKDYGFWVLVACPFLVCSLVLNNNLRYEGKAFYSMIGLTTGGILNIFGDYLCVRVLGLGVYGAGLATAVSQFISFSLLLYFYLTKAQSTLSLRAVSRETAVYLGIVRVGLPSLLRQGLASISNGLLNNMTKPFGDSAIAAISVVNRFSSLVVCLGLGIGQGFQPVASFNYQAGKLRRVKEGLIFTTVFGFCFIAALSACGLLLAPFIVSIFSSVAEVIAIGSYALRFASVGLLFLSVSVPVNMLYQSIRETKIASLLSLMRSGMLFIPTLLLLAPTLGMPGIAAAQPIADGLTGLLSIPFIIHFLRRPEPSEQTESTGCNE